MEVATGVSCDNFHWRAIHLLTENEVSRSWRNLLKTTDLTDDVLNKAEALLDELRPESPLRHRLGSELDELRKIVVSGS